MPSDDTVVPSPAHRTALGSDDICTGSFEIRPGSPRPVVIVIHASVGSGHRAAARAIAQSIDDLRGRYRIPENIEIEVVDVLDFGRIKFDGNKTAASFTGATRPIYDITWRYSLTGRLLWGGGTAWSHIMFPKFTEHVRQRRPLAIIATHIVGANVAVGARSITGMDYPVVCVPTDYEIEGWWPHRQTDLFCVATEYMAETLRARGVIDERITITGIPVRNGFERPADPVADRALFGLPQDKLIVLIMAGATLPQPYVRFRCAIEQTVPYLRALEGMHFVFLPGRDQEYSGKLSALFAGMGLGNVSVLPFVDDMAALMHGSDLAIMKSGGLTVTECLCAQLPMVLLGKSYGQEKANTTMLTSMGAGMHVTTARELVLTLKHLHDNPAALKALIINAGALRRPHAASDIVKATMSHVGVPIDRERHFISFYWGAKPAHTR
ncbi:Monogalactosyldiacylglycerol synthase [Coriobacterium glomerans PW2]|uniref:Monogalactosyldiacylglycerol synthase n=1 Tax=Coriobacterium glomerans (strain ATCC 49209 / DSM 20642 / JCM 10262 / PW2) TaxID=700015 RepID=F2N7W6_CORGP|nr:glycosyltransferase [Coriobacterium glomerans]AEB07075.1 Monogalactosyldiacylglycerol synthase [Coriobacterium glomerans PW2]